MRFLLLVLALGAGPVHAGTRVVSLDFSSAKTGAYTMKQAHADCGAAWSNGLDAGHAAVTAQADGTRFLRVTYTAGAYGPEAGAQFPCPVKPVDELTAETSVRFADGFDWVRGGKIPGMTGGKGKAGVKSTGDSFSVRYMWRAGGKLVIYMYHMDQKSDYGDDLDLGVTLATGRWYRLRHRVKLNTPDKKDGILQVWVDGNLVLDRSDIRYRSADTVKIDRYYFSTFFGGSSADWAPSAAQTADFAGISAETP